MSRHPAILTENQTHRHATGHSPARDIIQPMSLRRLESTVRYLGIEVDDAIEIAEQTDV